MHRFYLPPDQCASSLRLTGREAHHALHVLRVRRGEAVVVLDGAGTEFYCEVADCTRDEVHLAVSRKNTVPALPYRITLLQAIPKGKILDSIIQKATELGAARIVPLLSERVAMRLDNGVGAAQKQGKWQLTAVEAIKQCGSAWLPHVELPITLAAFLARGEIFDLPLVASLQPGTRHAREWFDKFRAEHHQQPREICIWVGPEGDFTAEEVSAVVSSGARPITLGRLVLRSETAAVYCLSILSHELQSLHWQ